MGASGEAVSIKSVFLGKAWPALSRKELSAQYSATSFFTPYAFRYYLPAFMTFMLEDMEAADFLANTLILQLTLPLEADTLQTDAVPGRERQYQ